MTDVEEEDVSEQQPHQEHLNNGNGNRHETAFQSSERPGKGSVCETGDAEKDNASAGHEYTHLYTLQGHRKSITSLSISPDGQHLASSGADGLLMVWSLATGALQATLDSASPPHDQHDTQEQGDVADDDIASSSIRARGTLDRLGVNEVAWSKDGRYLVCGGDDCIVRIWDVGRRLLVRRFEGHTSYVFCVIFHPDTSLTASGSFDESVRLWNIQRGSCHRTISAHSEAVTSIDFSEDGSMLASSSYDGLIRLWDTSTGQCLKTLEYGDKPPIGNIIFSPNSFQLLVASIDNTIRLWDIANSRVIKTYTGHQNEKFAIKASFSAYKTFGSSRRQEAFETSTSPHLPLLVVSGSEDQRIYLWDLQARTVVQTLAGHRDVVLTIATHPSVQVIASASMDHDPCIKIWTR